LSADPDIVVIEYVQFPQMTPNIAHNNTHIGIDNYCVFLYKQSSS
jgi:hypothetical protein